jgi:hypothetical protein
MLISVPIFSDNTYQDDDTSFQIGIELMKNFETYSPEFNMLFKQIVESEVQNPNPIIFIQCVDVVWESIAVDVSFIFGESFSASTTERHRLKFCYTSGWQYELHCSI